MLEIENIKYYDIEDLSKMYKKHKRTIYRWIKENNINIKKIKKNIFITESELTKFFK